MQLGLNRAYEDVYLEDPKENPDAPRWRVDFSDAAIEEYVAKVGAALERTPDLERQMANAEGEEERMEVARSLARLYKRVISTFIGVDGYDALLEWMGGGERIEPERYTVQLGEVFAAFLTMLGKHASNEQLRACGAYFSGIARTTKAVGGAPAPKGPAGGGKRRRKSKGNLKAMQGGRA